jgi:hypothetical protein
MRYLAFILMLFVAVIKGNAGVTIHYTGTAESSVAVGKVLAAARKYAANQKWKLEDASALRGTLRRMDGEKEKNVETKIRGIRITVAPMCEPLFLQFGDDLVVNDFVKTQYAGAEAHIAVIGLFELIRSDMQSLTITDEGEYWGSHKRGTLLKNVEAVDLMIATSRNEIQTLGDR